jgi:squalene synthase HpnC
MTNPSFAADLQLYGPQAAQAEPPKLSKSRRYCRQLARRHYENFTVTHWLLPGELRQHMANIYAYCRWADDLADEAGSPEHSRTLLGWWEQQLRLCYKGQVRHPVFVALNDTVRRFEIPIEPLLNLLIAFRQDQEITRYETFGQLLDYCRYSANPVGRIVLYLGRCHDSHRLKLSNSISTGLQLANFCQDVARDWDRGRIYLPNVDRTRFHYDEAMFQRRECNDALRQLLSAYVTEADGWLRRGVPLVALMPASLQLAVALFIEGGLAILEAIRQQQFDVWSRRPTLNRRQKLRLFASGWWRLRRGTFLERYAKDKLRSLDEIAE